MSRPTFELSAAARKEVDTCVHCGFCLPACPTYAHFGQEMDSPRGRIYLVKSLAEGKVPWTRSGALHLDRCLDCRACETACPAGVGYGTILEEARSALEPWRMRSPGVRGLLRLFLSGIVPRPRALAALAAAIGAAQTLGIVPLASWVGGPFGALGPLLPSASPRPFRSIWARRSRAIREESRRPPVLLLHPGCVMDVLFARTNLATARLLERAGYEVRVDPRAVCCGSLHKDVGFAESARDLARRNIVSFERSGASMLVTNAAGCGAHLKKISILFAREPAWQARARAFESKVRDFTEVLWGAPDLGARLSAPRAAYPHRVLYQEACHLGHAQRVRREPRELLRAVPGIELVESADPGLCCGSAGTYNLLEHETSLAILDRKMESLAELRPRLVVTANPGCLLQLSLGARRRGLDLEIVHLADFLDSLHARS